MKLPKNFDYKMLLVISIFVILFGLIFGFYLFPKFLHHMIKSVSEFCADSSVFISFNLIVSMEKRNKNMNAWELKNDLSWLGGNA